MLIFNFLREKIIIMKNSVKIEINKIIEYYGLDWNIEQFKLKIESVADCAKSHSLSEDFIREFQDKLDWIYISAYQKLSKDFILEFKNKVNWNYIEEYQNITEENIEEYEKEKIKKIEKEKNNRTKVKNKFKLIRF